MFEGLRKAYWRVKLNWLLRREGYCTKHYIPLEWELDFDGSNVYCLQCRQELWKENHRNQLRRQQQVEEAAKLLKELRNQ